MTDILIVDDDPDILSTLQEILVLNQFTVATSADAANAIQKVKESPFLVALLDIKLPDMDGTELLKEIRAIRPRIKCIMVTGYASLDNAVQSVNSGAAAYIMKPADPEDLIRTIRQKIRELESENEITEEKITDWASDQLLRLS
jgi:DNA-binding NtrC family response regulator